MTKIVVVYQSHYGTTKQYATWLAKAIDAELFDRKSISPAQLADYDLVIYGGGLYAGGLLGVSLVSKIKLKQLFVFTVGLADPAATDYSVILAKAFPNPAIQPDKVYHLRGGIAYQHLNIWHRALMALLIKKVKKIPESDRSDEMSTMLATYGKAIDFTEITTLSPLVDDIKVRLT